MKILFCIFIIVIYCNYHIIASSTSSLFYDGYTCHQQNQKEYCPSDGTCKPNNDCSTCDGKPNVDDKYHVCVKNNPDICHRQNSKEYCPADKLCHSGCNSCPTFTHVDNNKHICMQPSPETCANLTGGVYTTTIHVYCPHSKNCMAHTSCQGSCYHYKYADVTNHRCVHTNKVSPEVCKSDSLILEYEIQKGNIT